MNIVSLQKKQGLQLNNPCRHCWRNCALQSDAEIEAIDRLQDELAPLAPDVVRIRQLITGLELCHHKAERWVENIIAAIGGGEIAKGLGSRSPGRSHPVEVVWHSACTALSAWCEGQPGTNGDALIDTVPASQLLAGLGDPEPLKQWQVRRVIERIRSFIDWPNAQQEPDLDYVPLMMAGGDYGCEYQSECPDRYRQQEDFWQQTVRTIIHDTDQGRAAQISLAIVIDMLMPCHWRFVENLRILLDAIGGRLNPKQPFAACGRNINLAPIRAGMQTVCSTLGIFCGETVQQHKPDSDLLARLGTATAAKRWLAASLDKTIRLQLDPPADVRAISALAGPDWIRFTRDL